MKLWELFYVCGRLHLDIVEHVGVVIVHFLEQRHQCYQPAESVLVVATVFVPHPPEETLLVQLLDGADRLNILNAFAVCKKCIDRNDESMM